jgi:hypothetical protein
LHKLIVELDFPAIYTTNYDRNLETAFEIHHKPYAKIANAKHIADAAQDVTHIVKYHGDFDDDASLVLTETDFLDRLSFDSPLDIKFRADALGRTFCSLATACPTQISASSCTASGKNQVIGRPRLSSCHRRMRKLVAVKHELLLHHFHMHDTILRASATAGMKNLQGYPFGPVLPPCCAATLLRTGDRVSA